MSTKTPKTTSAKMAPAKPPRRRAPRTSVTAELLASAEEALAIVRGEIAPSRVHPAPAAPDVKAIRSKLKLSQAAFAGRFGFSAAAVREWEYKRRQPEAAARTLLLVIDRNPEVVDQVLQGSRCV